MLNSYFKRQSTLTKYYETPAGLYLDEFTSWLSQRGYQHQTIIYYIRGTVRFSKWLLVSGLPIAKITSKTLNSFREKFFADTTQVRSITKKRIMVRGAEQYIAFLRSIGLIVADADSNEKTQSALLCEFEQWMHNHRGVLDSTLKNYRRPINELLNVFGENLKKLTAKRLRKYIFKRSVSMAIYFDPPLANKIDPPLVRFLAA